MLKKFIGRFFATIGFMTVALVTLIVVLTFYHVKPRPEVPDTAVLEINLDKISINEAPTKDGIHSLFMGPSTSLFELTQAIDQAAQDPRIKELSIRANGVALGQARTQELRDAILRFRKRGKPTSFHTLTFGELTSATLHYYLATACDKISVEPAGFLNITGLFVAAPFAAKALDSIGVKARIGTREEYKSAMSFLTDKEMSSANAEETQSLLKELFTDMLKGIATERELSEETILKTMEESPLMTAQKAHSLGFIDWICHYDAYESAFHTRYGKNTKLYPIIKYIESLKSEEKSPPQDQDVIALIYAAGVIQHSHKSKGLASGVVTSESMRKAFEAAIHDPKVKAIIFRVNCPGGSAVISDSIARSVQIAQEHKIPVIASMSDVAASGGYWIIAGCNKIVAQPMTITGSIGVLGGKVIVGGLLEKLDINLGTISEGPNGSMWDLTQDYTEQQWGFIQGILDDIYARFIQLVADGRKLSIDHVKQIAKGRVWSGNQAKQFGLIDELGGIDKAIEVAKKEAKLSPEQEVRIVVYPKPKNFLAQLKSYYEDDITDGTHVMQAAYNTLCKLSILIQVQSQPSPVLAQVPDKIE